MSANTDQQDGLWGTLGPLISQMSSNLAFWHDYVYTDEFSDECLTQSDSSNSSLSQQSESSNTSSTESISHAIPTPEEAEYYYFGIRGPKCQGPKLIFRTSKDKFIPLSRPGQHYRIMQLLPAMHHDKLGKDNLWLRLLPQAVELLKQRGIQFTSIDLVRFTWVEGNADGSTRTVTTPTTIWVGVRPYTLAAGVAVESSQDFLSLLEAHAISDIDVAYRESVAQPLAGPRLYRPVSNLHSLKDVIDPVTTALGMPIAGFKTPSIEGTLGFCFRVGDVLYGVTARHVLFPREEGNETYSYVDGPKKQVILMGRETYTNLLTSVKDQIGALTTSIEILETEAETALKKMKRRGPDAEQAASEHMVAGAERAKARVMIQHLRSFSADIIKRWSEYTDRIIGYVVWAPPISTQNSTYGCTADVCVIRLDKTKFSENFLGNVIDLGTEIPPHKFTSMMYPRADMPSEFNYPRDRLLKLRGIFSLTELYRNNDDIVNNTNENMNNDVSAKINPPQRRLVLKRGRTTQTTIGRLGKFCSYVRLYDVLVGPTDSIEVAVYPYGSGLDTFSNSGDSGSLIADGRGKFVALLTSGAGSNFFMDVTYGMPFIWLWKDLIKPRYKGANLHFNSPQK